MVSPQSFLLQTSNTCPWIQALPEELLEKPHLLSQIFEFNKQNYLIVPIRFFTYLIQNSRTWRVEANKETSNTTIRLVDPPAIVIRSNSIENVICIIDSSFGMVDYYSRDGPKKRFIIESREVGRGIEMRGLIWFQIKLHSKADNALFKIPDAILEKINL